MFCIVWENSFLSTHAGFDMVNWFSGMLDRGKAFTDVRPLQVFVGFVMAILNDCSICF